MGDVIDFKKALTTAKSRSVNTDKLDVAKFIKFYEQNKPFVDDLVVQLCLQVNQKLDIEYLEEYDIFMLREAVMSLAMRGVGMYHPLQEFTDEFGPFFGGKDDYS